MKRKEETRREVPTLYYPLVSTSNLSERDNYFSVYVRTLISQIRLIGGWKTEGKSDLKGGEHNGEKEPSGTAR